MLPTSALSTPGPYDEALDRLHATGPEFDGYLSNHGPMVVEALARLDRSGSIHRWTDGYLRRLDDVPRGITPIRHDSWHEALGDPSPCRRLDRLLPDRGRRRTGDELVTTWWPRLLPGIAAGATHGVIRVGHAVRALRAAASTPRRHELAHALAYWATRWQPVPLVPAAGGLHPGRGRHPRPPRRRPDARHRPPPRAARRDARLARRARRSGRPLVARGGAGRPRGSRGRCPGDLRHARARQPDHARACRHGADGGPQHAAVGAGQTHVGGESRRGLGGLLRGARGLPPGRRATRGRTPQPDRHPRRGAPHGGEHVIKLTDTALQSHRITGRDDALLGSADGSGSGRVSSVDLEHRRAEPEVRPERVAGERARPVEPVTRIEVTRPPKAPLPSRRAPRPSATSPRPAGPHALRRR